MMLKSLVKSKCVVLVIVLSSLTLDYYAGANAIEGQDILASTGDFDHRTEASEISQQPEVCVNICQ
jgi:hypothetical protein